LGAALGLFPNGFAALQEISPVVKERIHESAIPLTNSQMKHIDGSTIREMDLISSSSSRVLPTFLVWYLLQQYLREDLPEGVLSLGHVLESFSVIDDDDDDDEKNIIGNKMVRVRTLNRSKDNAVETKTCKVLIGADGIKSVVRTLLFGEQRQLKYHGKMMFRAVMGLHRIDQGICAAAGISTAYQGEENGKLFAFRETAKGILTFTAMSLFEEPDLLHDANDRKKRLKELFSDYPSEVVGHIIERMPPSSLYENAVHDLEVEEQWSDGPVLLIGDAAHAMTPGMGQGANQGLEDACELAIVLAPALLLHAETKGTEQTQTYNNSSSSTTKDISNVLELFWRGRIDRVKEIHAASRARTASVNQSSSKSAAYSEKDKLSFTNRLYQWKPTSLTLAQQL